MTVVGSVNLDLIARCERLPEPGETVIGAHLDRNPGGKGANQAVAAARLGAGVRLIGRVGRDGFAAEALAGLREAGVDTDAVCAGDEPTGVALILVDAAGENQIVVASGANATLNAAAVELGTADGVMCQLEVPLEAVTAAAARAEGLFCLNAAPARRVPRTVLRRADVVVVNERELEVLDLGACAGLVAVTLGADGAALLEGGKEVERARPPAVRAVDATAAGDAFCAALVVSLLQGRPRREALVRACAAGALAAARHGAQPSLPTAAEVDEIVRR